MNNKVSRRIKLLIAGVLLLFLGVVIVDITPSGIAGFKAGYRAGREDARASIEGGARHISATIVPVDPEAAAQKFADGIEFRTIENYGDIVVPEHIGRLPVWATIWKIVSAFAGLGAMIVFLVHLIKFAVRFPRRRIMAHENIVSMRWIAGSLGVYGFVEYTWLLIDYMWLRNHVVLEGYHIGFESPSSALIVALILLAMTEIMNLAGKLQNEQELTI